MNLEKISKLYAQYDLIVLRILGEIFMQETLKLLPRIRPMYGFSRLYDWHFNNCGTYLGECRVPSSQTRSC